MENQSTISQDSTQFESAQSGIQPYFLGLDMGTSSLGFAVTDQQYNVIRKRGRLLWGIRLFEEAKTAAATRQFRTARRRRRRERDRIAFVRDVFRNALEEKDPGFLQRLQDSFFYPDDKHVNQKYSLFNDSNFTDVDFYKQFPTIYHLRDHLVSNQQEQDVRFVYLALIHIMKNRGHFLYPGDSYNPDQQFDACYSSFCDACNSLLGEASIPDIGSEIREVLIQTGITRSKKSNNLLQVFNDNHYDIASTQKKELAKLLAGLTCSFYKLFDDEDLKETNPKDCDLTKDYDTARTSIEDSIGTERIELIDTAYALFNWMRLSAILGDHRLLCEAKVAVFEKHKGDLRRLKAIARTLDKVERESLTNKKPYLYDRIFNINKKDHNNYVAYTGHFKKRGKRQELEYHNRNQQEFLKYLEKELNVYKDIDDPEVNNLLAEISQGKFLPLIVGTDNSAIPRQVVCAELKLILHNAKNYLCFLDDNLCKKIEQLFEFRIPYYVGPLNPAHRFDKEHGRFAWVVRKNPGKVYPWNIDEKIDIEKSAEIFIQKMTRDCSYLNSEKALPKQSLLYSEYMLLNIVNAININGTRLDYDTRKRLLQDLFYNPNAAKRVTRKSVLNWFISNGIVIENRDLGGFDNDIPVQLIALHDYRKLSSPDLDMFDMENIVKIITLFPNDEKMIRKRLKEEYGNAITEEDLKFLVTRRYSDWGRLSEKLLTGIRGVGSNDYNKTIIDIMREEPVLLMELLSDKYTFTNQIEKINKAKNPTINNLTYDLLDDYIVSPAVKRMIWQTLLVYKDIEKIMGGVPEKIFVEVAREDLPLGQRTKSRKSQLQELYRTCRSDTNDWHLELRNHLEAEKETALDSKRLFLYYLQQGRCAYSDEVIDIHSLYTNAYDIEHIYPRSLTKDDSIHNNLVLVKTELNRLKGDKYPVPEALQKKAKLLWDRLLQQGFMTKEKYSRLTRKTQLTADELAGFINRQLVETRQSVKVVTDILERTIPQQTRLVYVKAGHVTDFRKNGFQSASTEREEEKLFFVKCRELNDIHHAKDAYLNVVVGNVFDEKFTKNPKQFIAEHHRDGSNNYGYNLARLYENDIPYRKRNKGFAWKAGSDGTIVTVAKNMARNDVLYTEQTVIRSGGLFDQQITKASSVKSLEGKAPIKGRIDQISDSMADSEINNPLSNIKLYGAYDKVTVAHYALIETKKNSTSERSIEPVPLHVFMQTGQKTGNSTTVLKEYFQKTFQTESVRVIISLIPFNSQLLIDNYRCRIRGKTGNYYRLESHIQPYITSDKEAILAKVIDCVRKTTLSEYNKLPDEGREKLNHICEDRLSGVDLLDLMRYLQTRFETGPWKYSPQLSKLAGQLNEKICISEGLSAYQKCYCINQILSVMNCHLQLFDLSCFGLSKNSGARNLNRILNRDSSYFLVTRSPSGFFENKIDLWSV